MSNIRHLEVWNRTESPGDRLRRLASLADGNPTEWQRFVILYAPEEKGFTWHVFGDAKISEVIGMMEMVKHDMIVQNG